MKKLVKLALLVLIPFISNGQASKDTLKDNYNVYFYGKVKDSICYCFTYGEVKDLMKDVVNSIYSDSINADKDSLNRLKDAEIKTLGGIIREDGMIINDLKKEIQEGKDNQIRMSGVINSQTRKIWILKAERIVYPILTAVALISLYVYLK